MTSGRREQQATREVLVRRKSAERFVNAARGSQREFPSSLSVSPLTGRARVSPPKMCNLVLSDSESDDDSGAVSDSRSSSVRSLTRLQLPPLAVSNMPDVKEEDDIEELPARPASLPSRRKHHPEWEPKFSTASAKARPMSFESAVHVDLSLSDLDEAED